MWLRRIPARPASTPKADRVPPGGGPLLKLRKVRDRTTSVPTIAARRLEAFPADPHARDLTLCVSAIPGTVCSVGVRIVPLGYADETARMAGGMWRRPGIGLSRLSDSQHQGH